MKAILSYGKYLSYGKQYQIKFIYDDIEEAQSISNLLQNYNYNEEFKTSIVNYYNTKKNQTINIIGSTNIPKKYLLQFICELITMHKATIIIGNQEFNTVILDKIINEIDKLHINITLHKGKYFNFKNCYYVTFKYSSDEQREEVSYDFNVNLNSIIGRNVDLENENYIFPFIVDKHGKITNENTNIIGGTNIPEETLSFFLTRFIKEYNAVLTIGNEKIKDNTTLLQELSSFKTEKSKTRIHK